MKGLKWAQGGRRGAPGTGRAAEPRAPARGAPSGVTAAQGTLAMSRPPGAGASTALLWPPELKSSRHVGREGGRGAPSPAQTQRGRLQCAQCPQPQLQSPPPPTLAAQPPRSRERNPGPGRVSLQRRTTPRRGVWDFTQVSNGCTQRERLDLQAPASTPNSRDPT